MKNRGRLLEILTRVESGPIIDEKEFEAKLITSTVKRLISKYEIKFDKNVIVPSDDDLADRIFQAGMEFAVEVGMFCQDTNRRISWTEAEYLEGLRSCPGEVVMGTGNDTVNIKARTPESEKAGTLSSRRAGHGSEEPRICPASPGRTHGFGSRLQRRRLPPGQNPTNAP